MKKTLLRENIRKLKVNPHQQKNIQSQSPPHKKLLKKIEMTYKEPTQKYDFSLQDNFAPPDHKEEVGDFRVEIERRYQRSIPNKTYAFPRNKANKDRQNRDSQENSNNSSMESLRHVTLYDLASQNKKKKAVYNEHGAHINPGYATIDVTISKTQHLKPKPTEFSWDEDEHPEVPIEVKIRDKSSSTYKKLINFLDKHLGANNPKPDQPQRQARDETLDSKSNTLQTLESSKEHHGTFFGGDARPERPEKPNLHQNEFRQSKFLQSGNNFKKTLSSEKVPRIDTTTTLSTLEKSLGQIGTSSTKVGNNVMGTDSIKRIYNNSLLKSVTPSYQNGRNTVNLKDTMFRTINQDQASYATSLYMKAQNEVLSKNFRISSKSIKQTPVPNMNVTNGFKREETPSNQRTSNFQNFYGAPEGTAMSTLASQNNISKKNSFKTMNIASPLKKSDKQIYMSYDFQYPTKVKTPSGTKLDMTKRSAGREILSSSRNRGGQSGERGYEVSETYSKTLTDSQIGSTKKMASFTPTSNTLKNISFTRVPPGTVTKQELSGVSGMTEHMRNQNNFGLI